MSVTSCPNDIVNSNADIQQTKLYLNIKKINPINQHVARIFNRLRIGN